MQKSRTRVHDPGCRRRVLILGGTAEAAELAEALAARHGSGIELTVSLAGRTRAPRPTPGRRRVGGFGGAAGLAGYLRETATDLLVDATHPFAARISANAAEAAATTGLAMLRLDRPLWRPGPGDRWIPAADMAEAARQVAGLHREAGVRRVLLAIGRTELAAFGGLREVAFVVRLIEPTSGAPPLAGATYLVARPPFAAEAEHATLVRHGIEAVVAKNAGGDGGTGKLAAARTLGLPVVMVRRPPPAGGGATAGDVSEALAWIDARLAERRHHRPKPGA